MMLMNAFFARIKEYYPTDPPTIEHHPISSAVKVQLSKELQQGSYNIKESIEYLESVTHHCVMQYENHIELNIAYNEKDRFIDFRLYARVCKRILCCVRMNGVKDRLVYWLLPSNAKRMLPKAGCEVTPVHINGGYTYPSLKTVFIYRSEEAPKVLLHETIHNTNMDNQHWDPSDLAELYQLFNIEQKGCPYQCKTNILPNEAIVEFWAELYQCLFIAYEYNIPFETLIQKEQQFALQQAHKLLVHQMSLPKDEWTEKTHAFSYIVIRYILLMLYDKMIRIPLPYDPHIVTTMIKEYVTQTNFIKKVSQWKRKDGNKNLRMTCLGDF